MTKRKRGKKRNEWLCRELLTCPYFYTLVLTEKDYHREPKNIGIPKKHWGDFVQPGADATVNIFTHTGGKLVAFVCLGDTDGLDLSQVCGLLAHEAVHIWQRTKRELGEHTPGDEEEAYAVQRITQSLVDSYMTQKGL